jgi:ribosomal protein S18 acetylase RimI-like enzyme
MGCLKINSLNCKESGIYFKHINNPEELRICSSLFVRNVDKNYIAMGDIESDRINPDLEWRTDLQDIFEKEYSNANKFLDYIAVCDNSKSIIGFMILRIDTEKKYAVLYDIIIDKESRGKKAGENSLRWLEDQLRKRGIRRIILESGINNERAHNFFKNMGFGKLAVEFVKEL